ncbi:MAG TPA: hypothetical protein VNM90_17340 [Haliangium sp.]|nr:hypothetical protein [Haliangium sp.]
MRIHLLTSVCAVMGAACYSGSRAAPDVNAAWRGHARVELDARLGEPRAAQPQPDGTTLLRWTRTGQRVVELPSGSLDVNVTSTSFDVRAEVRPGSVEGYEYDVASAVVDPDGRVLRFDSSWLVAGMPSGLNLRTGVVFGLHGGAGWLNDATSPMPSLGLYLGGMIGPRLALLGAYAFVNGKDVDGFAMGHSWAFAAQYWPAARLAVRAGPAMVLDLDPGLDDPTLSPGVIGALSYALVRAGSFVLDLRFDATLSTSSAFGTLGVGVNVN